jgi:hypothetical protein
VRDFKKYPQTGKAAPYVGVSTLVSNAIKTVMRADMETRAGAEGGASIVMLNSLKDFLQRELTIGIAAVCMQNVAANSKHMSREEFQAYARTLQALTMGYKTRFGKNLATVIMVGITAMARDSRSAGTYLNDMLGGLSTRANTYNARIQERSRKADDLSRTLTKKQSSIIARIFGRGEIGLLTLGVSNHKEKITALEKRKAKCEKLASTIKGIANPQPAKPQR